MAQIQEGQHSNQSGLNPLHCNPQDYYEDIAHLDISQEEADEMLNALWDMMSTMVNIGWGVESIQIMLPELFEEPDKD